MCWIVAIKSESTYVHKQTHRQTCTHTHTPTIPLVVGLHAQIVLILSVLHIFLYTRQRQRHFDEDTRTHTLTTLPHYHCFSWRKSQCFCLKLWEFERKGENLQEERKNGWKSGKKKGVGLKKKHASMSVTY